MGQRRSEEMLAKCHSNYMAGFVANEICEKVWVQFAPKTSVGSSVDVNLEGEPRISFLKVCRMYRYLNFNDMTFEAKNISGDFALREPLTSGGSEVPDRNYLAESIVTPPKLLLFMFDISYSMTGQVGSSTRIAACKEQLGKMLTNEKIVGPDDMVGVVAFGFGCKYMICKSSGGFGKGADAKDEVKTMVEKNVLEDAMKESPEPPINDSRYVHKGGQPFTLGTQTWFFETLASCCEELMKEKYLNYPKWLIALTDGEPTVCSDQPKPHPGSLDEAKGRIEEYCQKQNNLVIITVSSDVKNEQQFRELAEQVQRAGGIGKYVAAKDISDSAQIVKAFSDVEQALVDVSGMTQAE